MPRHKLSPRTQHEKAWLRRPLEVRNDGSVRANESPSAMHPKHSETVKALGAVIVRRFGMFYAFATSCRLRSLEPPRPR